MPKRDLHNARSMSTSISRLGAAAALAAAALSCSDPPPSGGTATTATASATAQAPRAPRITTLDTDGSDVCAIVKKRVHCWGQGSAFGEHAGVREATSAPVALPRIEDAESVSVGGGHVCVLRAEGKVSCVRPATDTSAKPAADIPAYVDITGIPPAKAVSVTLGGGCIAGKDGSAWCWGKADGSFSALTEPRKIAGVTDVIDVAVSHRHACALRASGVVTCWGTPLAGEARADGTWDFTPGIVYEQIAGYEDHTCARNDATVRCLGGAFWGPRRAPSSLPGLQWIDVGQMMACGIDKGGKVVCFGTGYDGALGFTESGSDMAPQEVPSLTGAVEVAVGQHNACARLKDGAVMCWGNGRVGQLGDGKSIVARDRAQIVPLEAKARQVVAYRKSACALLETGALRCWGAGMSGLNDAYSPKDPFDLGARQSPDAGADSGAPPPADAGANAGPAGSDPSSGPRVATSAPYAPSPVPLTQVALSEAALCGVTREKKALCLWDRSIGAVKNDTASPGVTLAGLDAVEEVALGKEHGCARVTSGDVYCWGQNDRGQAGAAGNPLEKPTKVPNVQGAVEIAARDFRTCARLGGGGARCWGGDENERATDPPSTQWSVPVSDATGLVLGYGAPCLLRKNNEVTCYDRTEKGKSSEDHLAEYDGATSIAFAEKLTCLVRAGRAECLGTVVPPQPGADGGPPTTDKLRALDIFGGGAVRSVVAGEDFACALLDDGRVACFGAWESGQLGNGEKPYSMKPVRVTGLGP